MPLKNNQAVSPSHLLPCWWLLLCNWCWLAPLLLVVICLQPLQATMLLSTAAVLPSSTII